MINIAVIQKMDTNTTTKRYVDECDRLRYETNTSSEEYYELWCSEKDIILGSNFIEEVHLIQSELYPSLVEFNGRYGRTSKDIFDPQTKEYVFKGSMSYTLDNGLVINQYKTARICDILNSYLGKTIYIPFLTESVIQEGFHDFSFFVKAIKKIPEGLNYKINVLINSNFKELISNFLEDYEKEKEFTVFVSFNPVCYPISHTDPEAIIESNIENFELLIPEDIKIRISNLLHEVLDYIDCSRIKWEISTLAGNVTKQIVKILNDRYMEGDLNTFPINKIRFKVGISILCPYKFPIKNFIQSRTKIRDTEFFKNLTKIIPS